MLGTILLCFAFVFALFAALGWPNLPRVHMGWMAFALFVLAQLLGPAVHFFR